MKIAFSLHVACLGSAWTRCEWPSSLNERTRRLKPAPCHGLHDWHGAYPRRTAAWRLAKWISLSALTPCIQRHEGRWKIRSGLADVAQYFCVSWSGTSTHSKSRAPQAEHLRRWAIACTSDGVGRSGRCNKPAWRKIRKADRAWPHERHSTKSAEFAKWLLGRLKVWSSISIKA